MSQTKEWDEAYSLYSDLYKDRNGIRPRGEYLLSLTPAQLYEMIADLPSVEDGDEDTVVPTSGNGWSFTAASE